MFRGKKEVAIAEIAVLGEICNVPWKGFNAVIACWLQERRDPKLNFAFHTILEFHLGHGKPTRKSPRKPQTNKQTNNTPTYIEV